jgi:hypothetical protein
MEQNPLEKITVAHVFEKICAFDGTQRFITGRMNPADPSRPAFNIHFNIITVFFFV